MKTRLLLLCLLTLACAGCGTAFKRNPAYGKRPARQTPQPAAVAPEALPAQAKPSETNALSETFCPIPGRADLRAEFCCDVERPADAALSGFVDACLSAAYRHSRGEERKGVATNGAAGMREAFFADYREWFAEDGAAAADGDVPAHVGQWTCAVEGRVAFCDERHFSYRVTIDTYCGGAHGNRWVQNATYARRDGRRLTAADVVGSADRAAVVNRIRKALRAKVPHDDVLYGQLAGDIRMPYDAYVREIREGRREAWGNPLVTENFMVTADGVVWTYNQYEIACYASGWFDALVPWAAFGSPAQTP